MKISAGGEVISLKTVWDLVFFLASYFFLLRKYPDPFGQAFMLKAARTQADSSVRPTHTSRPTLTRTPMAGPASHPLKSVNREWFVSAKSVGCPGLGEKA